MIVKGITQVDEYTDPELLKESVVTELNNMILKGGKAYKRGALKRFNTNDGGTNTFISLFNVKSGDTNLVLGLVGDGDDDDDGILKKSTDGTGTWSNVKTGLNDTEKLRLATYKDKFLFTNGEDVPFVSDGTNNWDLDIDAPEVQGIATTLSSGGDLDTSALYRYILVYTTDDGQQSQVSQPFTHVESATDILSTSTDKTINFTGLPTSSDTRVTGRKLYRTDGGGEVFYLLTSLDNTATTHSDDVADADLKNYDSIELFQDIETAKYNLIHKDRYWLGNVVTGLGKSVNTPAHLPMTLTKADHGSAAIADGTYRYAMSFVDNQDRESELSSYVEITLDKNEPYAWTQGETQVTVATLPRARIGAGGYDTDIVHRRLYRTKVGDTGVYYYVDDINKDDTTYVDDTPDGSLGAVYPIGATGTTTAEKTHKCGVLYSNLGDPSEFNVLNYKEIYPDDGDEITGWVDQPDGVLVFKTNSVCKIYTQGAHENWRVVKLVENLGCDEPNSISEVENRVYFMNKKKVYRFPDRLTEPISRPKEPTISAVTSVYDSTFFVEKRWYVIATSNYVIHVYDEIEDCWYEFSSGSMTIKSLTEMLYGTNKGKLLLGVFTEAIMLYYDESTKLDYSSLGSDEDTEIPCSIKSKTWTKGESVKLRLSKLWSNYKKRDSQSVAHTLVNPETASQVTNSDTTDSTVSSDYKDYYKVTDAMTGDLRRCNKLRYDISGAGLDEFNFAQIDVREESGRRPNV